MNRTPARRGGPALLALVLGAVLGAGLLLAAPAAAAAPPTFTAPSYGATVGTSTPRFSGTGQPGDTVIVTERGVVTCTATVRADGGWSCVPSSPMLNGVHLLELQQTGRSGAAVNGTGNLRIVVKVAGERTPPTVRPSRARSTAPVAAAGSSSSGHDWIVPLAIAAIVALAIIGGVVVWTRMQGGRRA